MALRCLEVSEHTLRALPSSGPAILPVNTFSSDKFHFPTLFPEWPVAKRPCPRPGSLPPTRYVALGTSHEVCPSKK